MSLENKNKYESLIVEFHILQNSSVACLNRDDVGAPKTAMIGGALRARVSSQCWKRSVRLMFHEIGSGVGLTLASRTKLIGDLVKKECLNQGANEKQAEVCGLKFEQAFIGKEKKKNENKTPEEVGNDDETNNTLMFISPSEIKTIVEAFSKAQFDPDKVLVKERKKQPEEIAKILKKPNFSLDGQDIALFGRMVAKAASMNVEAAASFSHAISTHKVSNELDFFTALDDIKVEKEELGSGHMGTNEFNSATYYRYVCLNLGVLYDNLSGNDDIFKKTVVAFIKSLFIAIPAARQYTMAGVSPWEYAIINLRKGQRLQASFEKPVKSYEEGFLLPSKKALNEYLEKKEKNYGSLFSKIAQFRFEEDCSIDNLISEITKNI
ncbi:MAG: type I-E CRISPR-associated protein Cas7/Cse4/CasC [Candidatus Nanoarchaeia archaeon]|jgi:CRISPR system Cascade subunit CasC|nr:type I-E CRISPR-associated protein Cas7/Cse4/CasC [Candidatus Nanoarchaeia archaeon]